MLYFEDIEVGSKQEYGNYEVTLDDPKMWSAPWTVVIPLEYSASPIFEYACHEGNIGLSGILAGARELERQGRELRR